VLQFDRVVKRYGQRVAVDHLDFSVEPGEIFGLLGPNGAGKSTSVGLAVGILRSDAGRVALAGDGGGSPATPRVRARIGLAPQALALYELLSGEENLAFFGRLQGLRGGALRQRVNAALDFAGLSDRRRDRVDRYSGGMKRRLNLAAAILHQPRLLLLDEPTAGVDPQSRNQIFENILALKRQGTTIVYTTHYMEEAARLCDRVAIIDRGKLLALDTVPALLGAHGGPSVLVIERERGGEERHETRSPLADLERAVAAPGAPPLRSFRVEAPTLEQVFLNLTGRSLRD
jgi:ABC-2 type transport system ATP-binding protein